MILAYYDEPRLKAEQINDSTLHKLPKAIWIDLVNPSREEEMQVETYLSLDVPTREEMREIELSSRLYKSNDTLFMTAAMIAQSDSPLPQQDAVSFVLTRQQLITIRYIEPQAFKLFIARLQKIENARHHPASLLIELLDAVVDRLADILERVSHNLEEYSKTIFQQETTKKFTHLQLLQKIGFNGDLNSKIGESLITFNRLITFFGQSAESQIDSSGHLKLSTLSKDISALSDHANFLSNKVSFLLDATLGMIHIEQNAIIKIFSVAAVIFLPPTLIASIYGMNFTVMPELSWKFGYSMAIVMMLFSSWLPYKYFKRRKWL